uniref:Uncharacterized protein n=1 Tax=Romanomermis culicivorax TaxID=13658 RepID=A0A915I847_ROMCU
SVDILKFVGSQLFAPAERVACVEDLYEILLRFKELKSSAHDLIRFNSIGRNCQWDKEESISRSFNHLNTTTHCALAKARKITYPLFSILQDPYRLELTTKHLPSAIGSKAFDTPEL